MTEGAQPEEAANDLIPQAKPDPAAAQGLEGHETEREDRELEELRRLLFGDQERELAALRALLEQRSVEAEDVAEVLPDAVLLRGAKDDQLAKALSPTIDSAIQESVRNDPSAIADAIFPVIGPAIRKAIRQALAQTIESLNTTMEHSFSPKGIGWRLEAWRTGRPFAEIVLAHSLVWRVEQIFLIHAETGIVLEEIGLTGGMGRDSDLVASMLTAIQDFCADSFQTRTKRPLHEIGFDEFRVLVVSGPKAVLAAVVRGRAPAEYSQRLDQTIEEIHARQAPDLDAFDGDTSKFVKARPLLETCLDEEARPQKRNALSFLPVLLASLAVLLVAIYASRVMLESRRKTRLAEAAFALLDDTPGIFVGSYRPGSRADGTAWVVDGLLDPDADDPASILRRAGLDPRDVGLRWEAIRSFEAEILARRAARILELPRGARFTVEGSRLIAHGVVPAAWLKTARAQLGKVDGISAIQLETNLGGEE